MLNVSNIWVRILWGIATVASGAIHPFLLLILLICGIFIFSSYVEMAGIFLIWLMAYGIVDRWKLAGALLACIAIVAFVEWSKTRLIVY